MMKRRLTRFVVAGLAAAALATGSLVPTTAPAVAENSGDAVMNSVFDDGTMSVLEIVAGPEHVGEPVMILEGWAPGMGSPVAMVTMEPGATYVAVPTAMPGMVKTAVSPTFMVVWDEANDPGN